MEDQWTSVVFYLDKKDNHGPPDKVPEEGDIYQVVNILKSRDENSKEFLFVDLLWIEWEEVQPGDPADE